MTEPAIMFADVQYGDYRGTAACDEGDFENLARLLDLPEDQYVLGFTVSANHPLLNGTSADPGATSSYTHLTVWTVAQDQWEGTDGGMPAWLAGPKPLVVSSYTPTVGNAQYPPPQSDAIGLLLRASKRLNIVLWNPQIAQLGITAEDLDVARAYVRGADDSVWQEIAEEDA